MKKHLLARIEDLMPTLSKGQRLIGSYIIEHYDKAAFMTAAKLGATVGVSESTVVRFAMEVGYEGYPEMQKSMQEMIRNKLTSLQRMEVTSSRIGDADVLDSVLNQDINKIRGTMEEISHKDFYQAVDFIIHARKVYILAARSSAALGSFLGYYFHLILENVAVISSTSDTEIYEQMMRVGKEDVAIGISFPRYSKMAVKALRFASDRGANVIALTDSTTSPLVGPADCVLLARSDMASVVDSLVAPLSVLNALIVATALKKKAEITTIFESLERIWEEYEVYEKAEDTILE